MKIKILKQKKILGALQKLPAKQHSQSSPFPLKLGWFGCALQQVTSKGLPGILFRFSILIFIYFLNMKPYPLLPPYFGRILFLSQMVCLVCKPNPDSLTRLQLMVSLPRPSSCTGLFLPWFFQFLEERCFVLWCL